jgi:hypothetical protein
MDALIIELGVMVMLIFAGVIEGFVSPSRIGLTARIAVLVLTLGFWTDYLSLAALRSGESRRRRHRRRIPLRAGSGVGDHPRDRFRGESVGVHDQVVVRR